MPPVSYGRILSLFRPLFNNIYRAMKETPFVSVNSVDPAPRFRAAEAGDAGPCAAFPPDKAGRRIAAMGFPVRFGDFIKPPGRDRRGISVLSGRGHTRLEKAALVFDSANPFFL